MVGNVARFFRACGLRGEEKLKNGGWDKMRDFKKLDVWNRAIDFAVEVYRITEGFPKKEIYSLTDQIRRAAVSIFSNIAEGCRRRGDKELIYYCHNAIGSAGEVDSQLIFAERIGYLSKKDMDRLSKEVNEIGKMLTGFVKYVGEKNG